MTNLSYTYNEEELGWVTDKVLLSGSIFLEVELSATGRVCIKKGNTEDGEFPKIDMSPITGPDFEYTITGDAEGKYIQVVTSVKPNYIRYDNI